jgi:hypothetical protein
MDTLNNNHITRSPSISPPPFPPPKHKSKNISKISENNDPKNISFSPPPSFPVFSRVLPLRNVSNNTESNFRQSSTLPTCSSIPEPQYEFLSDYLRNTQDNVLGWQPVPGHPNMEKNSFGNIRIKKTSNNVAFNLKDHVNNNVKIPSFIPSYNTKTKEEQNINNNIFSYDFDNSILNKENIKEDEKLDFDIFRPKNIEDYGDDYYFDNGEFDEEGNYVRYSKDILEDKVDSGDGNIDKLLNIFKPEKKRGRKKGSKNKNGSFAEEISEEKEKENKKKKKEKKKKDKNNIKEDLNKDLDKDKDKDKDKDNNGSGGGGEISLKIEDVD